MLNSVPCPSSSRPSTSFRSRAPKSSSSSDRGRSRPRGARQIDRHFVERQQSEPALWNGRVLLLQPLCDRDGVLQGACFETDYASFLAWRDWDFPDRQRLQCLRRRGAASRRRRLFARRDGAARRRAPARIYFPCGTPDPDDISAGTLDLAGSVRRELARRDRPRHRRACRRAGLDHGARPRLYGGDEAAQGAARTPRNSATASCAISPARRGRNSPTSTLCAAAPISTTACRDLLWHIWRQAWRR